CTLYHFSIRPPPRLSLFPYTTLFRSRETYNFEVELCVTQYIDLYPPIYKDPSIAIPSKRAKGYITAVVMPNKKLPHQKITAHPRSEEHTSELQSRFDLVCRLLLEKKN